MQLQLLGIMRAPTVCWLLCLSLITDVSCGTVPFEISATSLTATEDSCIEIKCSVTRPFTYNVNAHWFWIKDAKWKEKDHSGTIVYSNKNMSQHPVSPDFKDRVTYTGSSSTSQMTQNSISICNLKMSDSGAYQFRYDGGKAENKWITKANASLTVKKNLCLVTFEKPTAVIDHGTIYLTCSTLSSCSSRPQIKDLTPEVRGRNPKSLSVTYKATWQDDGKEFSCQIENNKDKYLVKTIKITVEYRPRNTSAQIISNDIKEGDFVILNCSSSGHPIPTFQWFKDGARLDKLSGSEWKIPSVTISDDGQYYCDADNKHGTHRSNIIQLVVKHVPHVEVIVESPQPPFRQGQTIHLSCNVIRSNPSPSHYQWFKNQVRVDMRKEYVVYGIEPEDSESYTCEARNTVGSGRSDPLQINVQYKPRNTNIMVIGYQNNKVKRDWPLTFKCITDAKPAPGQYYWYRYSKYQQSDSSLWRTTENSLYLPKVQVDDEGCYACNATNPIDDGDTSPLVCIDVLYPPTTPTLTMINEVTEGENITIDCTVKSSPKSHLILIRSSEQIQETSGNNTLRYTFTVTSAHAGNYTCCAHNSEGSQDTKKMLLVKYSPKKVTVQVSPGLILNENTTLKLYCDAESYPPVSSFTWLKNKDGKDVPLETSRTLVVKSVTPSDSGLYSCSASNLIGSGKSQPVHVKVKYAPKHTQIIRLEEQQLPDGTRSVMLNCSSHSYPRVSQFTWYMKDKDGDKMMSDQQTYTVYSDQPGLYYCIAQNEIRGQTSEPVPVFMGRDYIKVIILTLIFLLCIVIIVFVYRQRRKKSTQKRAVNSPPWWSSVTSLVRGSGVRRPEAILAEPSRSRDEPLPAQPYGPHAHQSQHRPDNTGASGINTIYCTVQHPTRQEGGAVHKADSAHGSGHEPDDGLNYVSLHFDKKEKNRQDKANKEAVYAVVSKSKPRKKNELQIATFYGNMNEGHKEKCLQHFDTDTSEDEDDVDVSYAQVNIVAKPGCKKNRRDSSTSDEEQTQYTMVKL